MLVRPLSLAFFLLVIPCVQALDLDFIQDSNLRSCIQDSAKKKKWSNPSQVVELKCHSDGIESLEGINQFVELEKLSVYNNKIQNLPALKLPKLVQINIARNQLTSLDLDNLPRLEQLFFFDNVITRVKLSQLPLLQQLKGSNNQIVHFEYEGLAALEKMYLFDNKMEHIDIHRLPALKYMDVRQNPMPDELYEQMDKMNGVTFLHEGNAEDWQ